MRIQWAWLKIRLLRPCSKNVSREELLSDFYSTVYYPGVDVIPASIDDAFLAEGWKGLCEEHLRGKIFMRCLKRTLSTSSSMTTTLFSLMSGPHLDAFLKNCIGAADLMLTPLPPATVDFHSSLKFVASLPALIDSIEMDGHTCNLIGNVGFMSKILNKS